MTTKPVSIRLAVVNGKAVKSEFQQVGAAGADAMGKIERASGNMGQGIQNAAYQVGDFATQVAGGTDPMRALAQQLPQLLGGFGVFGAVAGAAAAILAPFAGQLFDFGDAADEAAEAMKRLGESGDAYRQSLDNIQIPLRTLREEFGLYAQDARAVQAALASIAQVRYYQAMSDFRDSVGEDLSGAREYLAEYRQMQAEIASGGLQYDAAEIQKGIIEDLREEYGMTIEAMEGMASAQDQLASASGPAEMAAAYQAIGDEIMRGLSATGEMSPEMLAVAESAYKAALEAQAVAAAMDEAGVAADAVAGAPLAANIGAGADEAARLATNMEAAARAAASARLAEMKLEFSPGGQALGKYGGRGTTSDSEITDGRGFVLRDGVFVDPDARASGGRRGGGGGGGGGADREMVEAQREIERWIKATRTEAEQYNIEMERLNELHATWGLDAETYARAIEQIGEKYDIAGDGAKYWADAMKDARGDLLDALAAGEDLTDVMDSLAMSIKRAAWEAILFGEGPFGSGGTGLLGGLFGGAQDLLTGGVGTVAKLASSAKGAASADRVVPINVNVSGARGNAEIEKMVASGVRVGIAQYDKQALPKRLKQITSDKRRIN